MGDKKSNIKIKTRVIDELHGLIQFREVKSFHLAIMKRYASLMQKIAFLSLMHVRLGRPGFGGYKKIYSNHYFMQTLYANFLPIEQAGVHLLNEFSLLSGGNAVLMNTNRLQKAFALEKLILLTSSVVTGSPETPLLQRFRSELSSWKGKTVQEANEIFLKTFYSKPPFVIEKIKNAPPGSSAVFYRDNLKIISPQTIVISQAVGQSHEALLNKPVVEKEVLKQAVSLETFQKKFSRENPILKKRVFSGGSLRFSTAALLRPAVRMVSENRKPVQSVIADQKSDHPLMRTMLEVTRAVEIPVLQRGYHHMIYRLNSSLDATELSDHNRTDTSGLPGVVPEAGPERVKDLISKEEASSVFKKAGAVSILHKTHILKPVSLDVPHPRQDHFKVNFSRESLRLPYLFDDHTLTSKQAPKPLELPQKRAAVHKPLALETAASKEAVFSGENSLDDANLFGAGMGENEPDADAAFFAQGSTAEVSEKIVKTVQNITQNHFNQIFQKEVVRAVETVFYDKLENRLYDLLDEKLSIEMERRG